jgi:hypothetical protein
MEDYSEMDGMGENSVHESFPRIGEGLTEKHGTPSEMHEEGVHRYISMHPHPMHMSQVV